MQPVYPKKLRDGDTLCILAPSDPLSNLQEENIAIAQKRLEDLGFHVVYGRHVMDRGPFGPTDAAARVEDLHAAFADPDIKGILCAYGGFSANQMLPLIDWELIARNPKVFMGYSDITALLASIYARTGLVTYHGPNFSDFGMLEGFEYSFEKFCLCLGQKKVYTMDQSPAYSTDAWWWDQEHRNWTENPGIRVYSPGQATGPVLGTNLCTLNLLQGTPYMPPLAGHILFLEDDAIVGGAFPMEFDRNLTSLSQCPGFEDILGLVIGRWMPESNMDDEKMAVILDHLEALTGKPVCFGGDFGHTLPLCTFPVGGLCRLTCTEEGETEIAFLRH